MSFGSNVLTLDLSPAAGYGEAALSSVQSPPRRPGLEYQPALDGVRALAIAAVLLFHGGLNWFPGGFLGVDVFFVLSGYLITHLLIAEWNSTARIDLSAFYLRRARRLMPALSAMLLTTLTCALFFMKDVAASTMHDLAWAFAGVSNWRFILHQQSYFEVMGRPALFQHTWSLAVEFQFYLVWPVAIAYLLPRIGKVGICGLALIFATLSAACLLLAGSGSHAYFGTDTRSVGLFIGSAAAAAARARNSFSKSGSAVNRFAGDCLGLAAIAGLIALFHFVGEDTGANFRAGVLLCGVGALLLIYASSQRDAVIGKLLGAKPLRWIGERSYSIYVWHWPVFQAIRPGIDVRLQALPALLLRIVVTAALAEVSYRYIEVPFRRGALGRFLRQGSGWNRNRLRVAGAIAVGLLVTAVFAETRLYRNAMRTNDISAELVGAENEAPKTSSAHREVVSGKLARTVSAGLGPKIKEPGKNSVDLIAENAAVEFPAPTLLLGDSVLRGAGAAIKQHVNVVKVDAVVGRQATELLARVESMARSGELEPTVVLDLGNNGTVDEPTLRAILGALRTCELVVVVNARVPRRWQDDNDALMSRIVPLFSNAVLADWRGASDGHPEFFGPDGVHTGVKGARAYADVVTAALQSKKPAAS